MRTVHAYPGLTKSLALYPYGMCMYVICTRGYPKMNRQTNEICRKTHRMFLSKSRLVIRKLTQMCKKIGTKTANMTF